MTLKRKRRKRHKKKTTELFGILKSLHAIKVFKLTPNTKHQYDKGQDHKNLHSSQVLGLLRTSFLTANWNFWADQKTFVFLQCLLEYLLAQRDKL